MKGAAKFQTSNRESQKDSEYGSRSVSASPTKGRFAVSSNRRETSPRQSDHSPLASLAVIGSRRKSWKVNSHPGDSISIKESSSKISAFGHPEQSKRAFAEALETCPKRARLDLQKTDFIHTPHPALSCPNEFASADGVPEDDSPYMTADEGSEKSQESNKSREGDTLPGFPTTPMTSQQSVTDSQGSKSAGSNLSSSSIIDQKIFDDARESFILKLNDLKSRFATNDQRIIKAEDNLEKCRQNFPDPNSAAQKLLLALHDHGAILFKSIQEMESKLEVFTASGRPGRGAVLCQYFGGFYDKFVLNAAAKERNGWLELGSLVPGTQVEKILIRESYRFIAAKIEQRSLPRYIVTGSPGIGKSLFLFYLLYRLVRRGERVLFWYDTDLMYYDGRGLIHEVDRLPKSSNDAFWKGLWCLFDATARTPQDLHRLGGRGATIVVSMCPRRELINDFKKPNPSPKFFYMPVWSKDELDLLYRETYSEVSDWLNRFEILGGIPRLVFDELGQDPSDLVESASFYFDLTLTVDIVGTNAHFTDKLKVVHSIVHIHSEEPYEIR